MLLLRDARSNPILAVVRHAFPLTVLTANSYNLGIAAALGPGTEVFANAHGTTMDDGTPHYWSAKLFSTRRARSLVRAARSAALAAAAAARLDLS